MSPEKGIRTADNIVILDEKRKQQYLFKEGLSIAENLSPIPLERGLVGKLRNTFIVGKSEKEQLARLKEIFSQLTLRQKTDILQEVTRKMCESAKALYEKDMAKKISKDKSTIDMGWENSVGEQVRNNIYDLLGMTGHDDLAEVEKMIARFVAGERAMVTSPSNG